jgi:ribosomal protein S18 acetylase RimI-like enzyme
LGFSERRKTREADQGDKPAVIALWERCCLTRPWNDPSRDFDFAYCGPSSTVIVLEREGAIIGAALVGHDGHRGATYYVGVEPDLQRSGIGRALMTAVEDWLRARGVWKLNLLVRRENAGVIRFYEKLGYGDQDCVSLGKTIGWPGRSLCCQASVGSRRIVASPALHQSRSHPLE